MADLELHSALSLRLDSAEKHASVFHFFFFFFLEKSISVYYIVYETHESHVTVNIFKNYFTTEFSVFNKISGI